MSDELTAIARKSYGESAFVVRTGVGFMLYVERKPVWYHETASQEEAFRELKMKLETMAMLTDLHAAGAAAKDAAETKRMADEFAVHARRVYGPTSQAEFFYESGTFVAAINDAIVIEDRADTVREAFDRAMDRLDDAAYNQITIEQRTEFLTLASIVYPEALRAIDSRKFVFSVVRDGTPIVSETGATMLDAYNAVMARLRAVSVKAEEPSVPAPTPEVGEALVKFHALPALVADVFGDDAQVIVHPRQPYVTIESRIGKHTVFASSASATTPEAVSEAHAWLTAQKVTVPFDSTLRAQMDRVHGPSAQLSCEQTTEGWSAIVHAFGKEKTFKSCATRAQVRSKVLAHLLCLPSKIAAASEATAPTERTTGVSEDTESLKNRVRDEARRVGGENVSFYGGSEAGGFMFYVTLGTGINRVTMSEKRETATEACDAMVARLRAMPTIVTPAAPTNDYLVWGSRDTMPYPDGTTFSNGSAPVNLKLSITNTTPEQKATPTMTTPTPTAPTIAQTLAADADAAAWRLAGSQFVKLAKEPLVALLSRHLGPGDDSLRARIAAFLDTEFGFAIVTALLAAGLSAVPAPPGSKAATINAKLARELRVNSMAVAADALADVLAGPMRQVIAMYLSGDPSSLMGLPDGADRIVVPSTVAAAEVSR